MKSPQTDYTSKSCLACLLLIGVLVVVSLIPPLEVCGVQLRRANILSEFVRFEEPDVESDEEHREAAVEQIEVDWQQVAEAVSEPVAEERPAELHLRWFTQSEEQSDKTYAWPDSLTLRPQAAVVIEDFDTTGCSLMDSLYHKLLCRRPVRIAFLGDSFVEGDILTADLREQLQLTFGGSGVGFAPMASPLTGFRRTVKTTAKGWTSHNIMQFNNFPEEIQRSFTIAGWVCRPTHGATTRWEGTNVRQGLEQCDGVNLWFLSRQPAELEITLNDSLKKRFQIEPDEALRRIEVRHPELHTLECKVLSGPEGFVGYGAQFFGREGVVVDNYSVRSNNGRALFWSSPSLNAQLQAQAPYDLVVLQYGLNIMQQGVLGYKNYGHQIEQMVDYVRQCFPGAAVLVLGVSERWVKGESGFLQIDALPAMVESQRTAARNAGAAFWATSEAMRSLGGMETFVRNGWAGKDYTHINYAGGRRIALALYEALCSALCDYWQRENPRHITRREQEPVLESELVDSLLFTPTLQPIP